VAMAGALFASLSQKAQQDSMTVNAIFTGRLALMFNPLNHSFVDDPRGGNGSISVAGIHLSGPNARKSAIVILSYNQVESRFVSLYEKIGSVGSLFSDERVIEILRQVENLRHVFVDCPTTEPPCVKCERPVCPGVLRCEDVAVGMMLAINQKRGRKGAHKLRPLNPQNMRLWDAMYGRGAEFGNMEPSYSANLAPLVVRARTLQRRLCAEIPHIQLRETHIPFLLRQMEGLHGREAWALEYRAFERGLRVRTEILNQISGELTSTECRSLHVKIDKSKTQQIVGSVEVFQAFMAAAMAVWSARGLSRPRSNYFSENSGWVELLDVKPNQPFER
jgi:hypothetical protein